MVVVASLRDIGTDLRHAIANSAGTAGYCNLVFATTLAICAHARSVWIGPDIDCVTDGSMFLIDEGARDGIKSMLGEGSKVVLCAVATASSGGSAVRNLMMM